MNFQTMEKSIFATLIYYDCFNWPLSTFELWSRLIRPLTQRPTTNDQRLTTNFSLSEIIAALEHSAYLKKYIAQENGFWFLRGRQDMWLSRIQATKDSEEKLARVFKYRWVFKGVPFLSGAFVSGSVAGGWPGKESDIDILIVAKRGRIWTARLFLTLFTNVLGIRRKGADIANQLCLNHYITDGALEIPFQSLYNVHTYVNLIPVVNRHTVFERFFRTNHWMDKYFSNTMEYGRSEDYQYQFPTRRVLERASRGFQIASEFLLRGTLGDFLEKGARALQQYFIQKNPSTGKRGGRIQAHDFQLEFHPQSKERDIISRYNKKLKQFGLTEFYPEQDSGLQ